MFTIKHLESNKLSATGMDITLNKLTKPISSSPKSQAQFCRWDLENAETSQLKAVSDVDFHWYF